MFVYTNVSKSSIPIDRMAKIIKELHVITDSGHGWLTEGKRSTDGSLRENEFNSAVEDKVTYLLDQLYISYDMLAPEWNDVKPSVRIEREHRFYDNAIAKGKKLILGTSIHADAFENPQAHGRTIFHYDNSIKGLTLAENITKQCNINLRDYPITSRGIKTANFFMLRDTKAVWNLCEAAFMTNEVDLKWLKDDGFRNDFAKSIVEAILLTANELL